MQDWDSAERGGTEMAHRVLISEAVAQEGIQYLEQLGYEVKRGRGPQHALLLEDIRDCDGVIVRVAEIDREIIEQNPQLKVIAKHGAGYDNIDTKAAAEHGVRVVFAPTANSHSVAEHTMALILACAKKIPYMAMTRSAENAWDCWAWAVSACRWPEWPCTAFRCGWWPTTLICPRTGTWRG